MHKKCLSLVLLFVFVSVAALGCGQTEPTSQSQTPPSNQTSQNANNTDTSNLGAKLSSTYADMMKNNKYFMKYKGTTTFEGNTMEIEASIAVSGDNMAVTSEMGGIKSTIITKDDKSYMVNHAEKMVMELPQNQTVNNSEEINTDGLTYVSSGTEDGLAYEKYSTDAGFITYYFDGDKLVKMTVTSELHTMTMTILEMSSNVPDSLFEIPADYTKITMPS
jgi:hypothetical protein